MLPDRLISSGAWPRFFKITNLPVLPAELIAYEKGDFFNYLPDETPTIEEKTWLSAEEQMVKNLLAGYAWQ